MKQARISRTQYVKCPRGTRPYSHKMIELVVSNITNWNWNEKKKPDNVHLEVVNPRICLLGEGRSFRSAPLVLWVSQVKNPVIISIVGISLQSATSSKGIYNRCGPRKNNLTHTEFDPFVEFKIFSRGFRTIFDMFIVQKCSRRRAYFSASVQALCFIF